MISSPDFAKAYIKANEILVSSNYLVTFPFSVSKVVKEDSKGQVRTASYNKAEKYNLTMEHFGSDSGILINNGEFSIIFYNSDQISTRCKFSILHEYGHFKLKHIEQNVEYRVCEVETNYFAAQLLMPEQLIRELARRGMRINANTLIRVFGVSKEAAQKRIKTMNITNSDWKSPSETEYDDIILKKYSSFLDSVMPIEIGSDCWMEDEDYLQESRNDWF